MKYEEVIDSAPVVLVEFYASWCPHCQRMMPLVAGIKRKMAGKVEVVQYDVDKFDTLSDENDVESYPTFIIYKDGREVWRNAGEMPEADLIDAIRSFE